MIFILQSSAKLFLNTRFAKGLADTILGLGVQIGILSFRVGGVLEPDKPLVLHPECVCDKLPVIGGPESGTAAVIAFLACEHDIQLQRASLNQCCTCTEQVQPAGNIKEAKPKRRTTVMV